MDLKIFIYKRYTIFAIVFFFQGIGLAETKLKLSTQAHAQAFFSSQENLANKLIELIEGARRRIFVAVYALTHKDIANALVEAHKRKVKITIIVDKLSMSKWGKAEKLCDAGINCKIFNTGKLSNAKPEQKGGWHNDPIMHNKYAIVDDLLWTGSFNFTISATFKNKENALLLSSPKLLTDYLEDFTRLEEQAISISEYKKLTSTSNLTANEPAGFWNDLVLEAKRLGKQFLKPRKIKSWHA